MGARPTFGALSFLVYLFISFDLELNITEPCSQDYAANRVSKLLNFARLNLKTYWLHSSHVLYNPGTRPALTAYILICFSAIDFFNSL